MYTHKHVPIVPLTEARIVGVADEFITDVRRRDAKYFVKFCAVGVCHHIQAIRIV